MLVFPILPAGLQLDLSTHRALDTVVGIALDPVVGIALDPVVGIALDTVVGIAYSTILCHGCVPGVCVRLISSKWHITLMFNVKMLKTVFFVLPSGSNSFLFLFGGGGESILLSGLTVYPSKCADLKE